MRHTLEDSEEYAVHDIYFEDDGKLVAYTQDAISSRASSLQELGEILQQLLKEEGEEVTCGDLNYTYHKEDVQDWIDCLDKPVIDYLEDEN